MTQTLREPPIKGKVKICESAKGMIVAYKFGSIKI